MTETAEKTKERQAGLRFERYFVPEGKAAEETVDWGLRDARIEGKEGVVFEQRAVEFPKDWDETAAAVVASKYFRGQMSSPDRERSLKQMVGRVAGTIKRWGLEGGYFASEADAERWAQDLGWLIFHQHASFNSPVWFNIGVPGRRQAASACFINSIEDNMGSIMDLAKTEALIFQGGSGAGVNLSVLRGSKEQLSGGGYASGPVSFMRGYDSFAGVIKCLTPDAYIHTNRGLQRLDEIVDLALPTGFHEQDSIVVATKNKPARISHVYVSPVAPTLRMQLRHTGLTLRGTEEHPVLTMASDFSLSWKRLRDIAPGDRVAVARRMELWPSRPPSFSTFSPVRTWAKKPFAYPEQLTPALARLLGYLVAEGSMDKERFRFLNADEDVFADFLRCVKEVFEIDPIHGIGARMNAKTGVVTQTFEACWPQAVRFLQHVGFGIGHSDTKVVPWSIRQAPRALVAEFMRAYFEGDGHNSHMVYAASASRVLLQEIQLLLLNMGIVATLRRHPSEIAPYWNLNLRGEAAELFLREVGFVSARKQQSSTLPSTRNTNVDTVPFFFQTLQTRTSGGYMICADGASRRLGFGFFNRRPDTEISYARLRQAPDLLDDVGMVNPEWAATLKILMAEEYFWDRVEFVEPAEEAVTYDFTVPVQHSFIANGIVNHNSGGTTRRAAKMVILNADHPDIEEFVKCKQIEEHKAWALIEEGYNAGFNVPGGAYESVMFQNANHSVRATDEFMRAVEANGEWPLRARVDGHVLEMVKARKLWDEIADAAWDCGDPGLQFDDIIQDWNCVPNTARINATNPCGEFIFLDSTACNLLSFNLMKFWDPKKGFDAEAYRHAIDICFTGMEILVGRADYPTEKITENSHKLRPLGIGYANLGALLMAAGLAYDSEDGRQVAGAITALLTGQAYTQSARMAGVVGPFQEYEKNAEAMLSVMDKHRTASRNLRPTPRFENVLVAARASWDEAIENGTRWGYRNAQSSVVAPTGTISLQMGCDTTGVEPDLALVKYKRLVGGGMLKLTNQGLEDALRFLGYSESEVLAIIDYIRERDTIEGAPGLKAEHLPIFDCAFKPLNGVRSIAPMGHVRMLAAVQPFTSGGISKTCNLPTEATQEDIKDIYMQAWKLGIKCIAIYRDGCKRSQPLSTKKEGSEARGAAAGTVQVVEKIVEKPRRRRLPLTRKSVTHKFEIASNTGGTHEGYITVGMYEDGTPGEIFVKMAKEGSTISGVMEGFGIQTSLALQYGVPLGAMARKFVHMRFEPSGYTQNPDVRIAKSILDYIFRWLISEFGTREEKDEAGVPIKDEDLVEEVVEVEPEGAPEGMPEAVAGSQPAGAGGPEQEVPFQNDTDAPSCSECGAIMVRGGSCYRCLNCGATAGCS